MSRASIAVCASAAFSSGKVWPMIGVIRPAAASASASSGSSLSSSAVHAQRRGQRLVGNAENELLGALDESERRTLAR